MPKKGTSLELLKRVFFTFYMLFRHRQALINLYHQSLSLHQVLHLSPRHLKQQGINVLVLDFDGVLAAHGELSPLQELHAWLHDCLNTFGRGQVFILSNQPLYRRVAYFNRHYAGVQCVVNVRKKPYPDGLEKILALTGQPAHTVMLVDDRLLTGALAACLAKVRFAYVRQPYCDWSKRPLQELLFAILRVLERCLVGIKRH